MGFRDEQLAGQERVRALESEVERLKVENAALKAGEKRPHPRPALKRTAALPLVLLAFGLAVGALLLPLPGMGPIVMAMASVIATMMALMMLTIARTLLVVEPGELLVLSGRPHRGPDGQVRGYRIVRAGRVLRIPIVESVDRMELGPFPFEAEVARAFARGNVAVRLHASAAVELSSDPASLPNAVERFLGRTPEDIVEVARQTLEGMVRAVVAELTLDQLQQETPKVSEKVSAEVASDLEKLGLSLTSLVIDDVSPSA